MRDRVRGTRLELLSVGGLLAAFTVARVLYHLAGVRFDATPLVAYWQYLDPVLLRTDLWRSLWHLHSQPPLYNLFLGVMLKLLPGSETGFAVVGVCLGGLVVLITYLLARRLGAGRVPALAGAGLYAVSPTLVLYENWLHYTLPVVALLLGGAFVLERAVATRRAGWFALFGTSLAAVCLTMSFFHALFTVLVGLAVAWGAWTGELDTRAGERGTRAGRRAALAAGVALAVVLGWYSKNLVQFGTFSSSTWLGMSLARMTHTFVPRAERESLAQAGRVSPLAVVAPFSPLEAYAARLPSTPATGIEALDQSRRSTGASNFNNLAYVGISRLYARDALWLARHRPAAYLRSLLDANLIFFMPATAFGQLGESRRRARWAINAAEVLQGRLMFHIDPGLQRTDLVAFYRQKVMNCGLVLPLLYLGALVAALALTLRWRRRMPARAATFAYIAVVLGYVWLAGTFLEVGENMRFRSLTDPLVLLVLAVALTQARPGRAARVA